MNAYIFVVAAILAVVPVVIVFKIGVNKLLDNPGEMKKVQRNFFIGAAMSKIVPAILLMYGIIKMTPIASIQTLFLPWGIIGVVVIGGLMFIESQKNSDANEEAQKNVNMLVTITRPHLFTVPLMAAVFLFLMTL